VVGIGFQGRSAYFRVHHGAGVFTLFVVCWNPEVRPCSSGTSSIFPCVRHCILPALGGTLFAKKWCGRLELCVTWQLIPTLHGHSESLLEVSYIYVTAVYSSFSFP